MVNEIGTIEKLYAKVKIYKIPKEPKEGVVQVDIEITPLSVEDMGLLDMKEDMSLPEIAKNTKIMFSKSLGISEEQASKISVHFMEELLVAVMDANDFKESDIKKTGIKDFIKKKQEQMKAKEEDGKSITTA